MNYFYLIMILNQAIMNMRSVNIFNYFLWKIRRNFMKFLIFNFLVNNQFIFFYNLVKMQIFLIINSFIYCEKFYFKNGLLLVIFNFINYCLIKNKQYLILLK